MAIQRLDHYNIATSLIEETRAFYETALGLKVGRRPNFPSPGYWMYEGDHPWVHLSTIEAGLSPPRTVKDGRGNGLDHISFWCTDVKAVTDRLDKAGVAYEDRRASDAPLVQLFIKDPNGILVELTFDAKVEGVWEQRKPAAAPA